MERFKVCEKEMKTKAFSKEGLGQAAKLDPREKARNEMRDWINETVDKLTAEVRHPPNGVDTADKVTLHMQHFTVLKLSMPAISFPQGQLGSLPMRCLAECSTKHCPVSRTAWNVSLTSLQCMAIPPYLCMLLDALIRCMMQTETFDAEMEGLASNVKKNKKLPARHGHLEESISRHKQHITRLEQMLRLLDNEVREHHFTASEQLSQTKDKAPQGESGVWPCLVRSTGACQAGWRFAEKMPAAQKQAVKTCQLASDCIVFL